jgi:membrane protease YdiL (CAAX protease family)
VGDSKRNVDLDKCSWSDNCYPARRTVALALRRSWYSELVDVDFMGTCNRVVLAVVVGGLAYLTGFRHGPGSAVSDKLPLWLILLIVFRAGVVEELFYRGYAIERLRMVGFGRFWSITIPLVVFSLAHWSGGAANSLIAFAAGAVLTGFYLWHRNVVANMIGHCLVGLL